MTTRARYADVIVNPSGVPVPGATVDVYDTGTTTPIAGTIHDAAVGGGTLPNPVVANAQGEIEFWLDDPARVDLKYTRPGYVTETHTVEVLAAAHAHPELIGTYAARNGVLASVVRDSLGRVTSLVEDTVAESYTRDAQGRVATITVGSTTRTVSRDATGRVTGVA